MHKTIFALLGLILLLSGCVTEPPTPAMVWIDVRTQQEFSEGHVEGAVNIPYEEIATGIAALQLQPDTAINLYCRSGKRAGIARETLLAEGYQQVTNVGGLEDARALQ